MNEFKSIVVKSLFLILVLLFSSEISIQAQNKEKIVFDLSGNNWQMEGITEGKGVELGFPDLPYDITGDAFNWIYAKVPGDVYTDLWRSGRLDDPHFGRNSLKAKWVPELEWWYKRQFDMPKTMQGKKIQLVLEGVDFAADVFFNGKLLGTQEGMFTIHKYDITDLVRFTNLRFGTNMLMIRLHPAPRRYSQVAGRKPAWHGDYWVSLPPTGIWRPVYVEATGDVTIEDTYVKQEIDVKKSSAKLDVQVELNNNSDAQQVKLDLTIAGENFKSKNYTVSLTKSLTKGLNKISIPVDVPDAKLWYPWDLGEQNMYKANVKVTALKSGLKDETNTSFGIREVKMVMNPGWTKEQVEHPWTVTINGMRHYMRSATWGGPPDIFMGRAHDYKYKELIRLAKEANINNLRIFGWHPSEIPLFYQLCNEAGITVWEDIIPIASLSLPEDQDYKKKVFDEAISVVKQQRNNPCLVLLEGGEEILMTAANRPYNLQVMKELGEVIKPYTDLSYIPLSPLSDEVGQSMGFKPNESYHANDLFYGEGNMVMEDYFRSLDYAVIPELAISACPNVESIKKFIPENEMWPPGPSWGHHWCDFDVFRTLNYEVLGNQSTGSIEEFVNATQIAQGTIFQYALERYRQRKPKSSAICICHFITFAPDMKWGIVDYYRQTKQSYDYVKRAYQPMLVCLEYDKRRWMPGETFKTKLWIVNDFYKDFDKCTVAIKYLDNNKQVIKNETVKIDKIAGDSSKDFVELTCKTPGNMGDKFYVELSLTDKDGKEISANQYMLMVADQELEKANIKAIGVEALKAKDQFGWANYYRYFKGLGGEDGIPEADEKMPSVNGFE